MASASLLEHDLFRKPASTHRVAARGQAFRDHARVMRILVPGVPGQVGGALTARPPPSATVLAADRRVLDLAAPQTLAGALDRLRPDLIFNPAAYTAVDK